MATNWLIKGAELHNQLRKSTQRLDVTISRTDESGRTSTSMTVIAAVGRTTDDVDDQTGGILRTLSRDYIIQVVDYRPDPSMDPVRPQRGDIITELKDGAQYEVLSDLTQSVWDWHDPVGRTAYRVRTKATTIEL